MGEFQPALLAGCVVNKAKWTLGNVPMVTLAAKLAEEVGEVAKEILDADEDGYVMPGSLRRIEDEATQVEFLASVIKSRAQALRMRHLANRRRTEK